MHASIRSLKLCQPPLADGWVKSLAIINRFDGMLERGMNLGEGFMVVQVDLFAFERAHQSPGFETVKGLPLRLLLEICIQQGRDVIGGRAPKSLKPAPHYPTHYHVHYEPSSSSSKTASKIFDTHHRLE